jgi:amino-acid racemase
MKTIGLLGGMSWESTVPYYQIINRAIARRLGGLHSARLVLYSVDFDEIAHLQHANHWTEAAAMLTAAARCLEDAGADFVVLCTNTMHRVASDIEAGLRIPLLHIADPTARALAEAGISRIGLLATKFTMEHDFYRGRLESRFGLTVLVPDSAERDLVHRVIYDELCRGIVSSDSRTAYQGVASELQRRGAQALVLGCTEIGLLLGQDDVALPVFDTTVLHAEAAAAEALGSGTVTVSIPGVEPR